MESSVAIRYAKALLSLTEQENKSQEIAQQLQDISQTIKESSELRNVLVSKTLSSQVKRNTLLSIFKGQDRLINNTIEVLLQNKRIVLLQQVADQYLKGYEKSQGLQQATVTTATPLDSATEAKVQEKIIALTGAKATLVNKIDPSIVGGFILRVGDLQYNASVKNQLLSIKRELSN